MQVKQQQQQIFIFYFFKKRQIINLKFSLRILKPKEH